MPIVTPHLLLYQEQLNLIEQIHIDRIAAQRFIDLKEDFYKREIPLKKICLVKDKKQYIIDMPPEEIALGEGRKTTFDVFCKLSRHCKDESNSLVIVELCFDRSGDVDTEPEYKYKYKLMIKKEHDGNGDHDEKNKDV